MTKNVAASVRAQLAARAKETGRPFQEVLQFYGLERFLYRLAQSQHRNDFLLKEALLLRVWAAPESRPTRDIDLLGYVDNEIESLEAMLRKICEVEDAGNDGLLFDTSTIEGEKIKEDADYVGVRIKFTGFPEKNKNPNATRHRLRRHCASLGRGKGLPDPSGVPGTPTQHLSSRDGDC